MKAASILIAIYITIVLSTDCILYQCATNPQAPCADFNISSSIATFNPNICTQSQYCDISNSVCVSSQNEIQRMPGRQCNTSYDCITNTCTNGICIGRTTGQACPSDAYCDIGLYCNSTFRCDSLLSLGSSCKISGQCINGLGCHFSKCVKYASIDVGSSTDASQCVNYLSDFCKTGQCYPIDTNQSICINPFSYKKGDVITCSNDNDCSSQSDGYPYKGTCQCGMNPNGTMYCSVMFGSSYGIGLWNLKVKWFNSTAALNSHRQESTFNSLKDWGTKEDFYNFLHYSLWLNNGQYLQGIPSCVVSVVYPGYVGTVDAVFSFAVFNWLAAGFFILV